MPNIRRFHKKGNRKSKVKKGNKALKKEAKNKKSKSAYLKKEVKLRKGGDERRNHSGKIQRRLKDQSNEHKKTKILQK